MSGRLAGKVAIVTGAASGIGRATSKLFAREGAKVVCFDRAPEVAATAEAILGEGGAAIAVQGDAGLEADVAGVVEQALHTFGRLDVFYANAGISGGAPGGIFDATPEIWLETLRINLVGPFLAVKHAAPAIEAAGGGAIVCTASVAGLRSGAGPAHYSASKAGVINLVQTAAQQLAGSGVRVNAICPGLIETELGNAVTRARGPEIAARDIALRRLGSPDDIAQLVVFLATSEPCFITGQTFTVDGFHYNC